MTLHKRFILFTFLCGACLTAAVLLAGVAAEQAMASAPAKGTARICPVRGEDSPGWDWTACGNHRRGVVTMWGTPLVVSAHRFCLLHKRGNLSPGTPRLRGDRWAIRNAC